MLPRRADPVAGALVGTFVLAALLALPVLILALIVWIVVRASRTASPPRPEVDADFSSRFHELEEGILDANGRDAPGTKSTAKRPARSRRRGRPVSDQ